MKTKKIILSILVLLFCLIGNAQNNLFDKYSDLHNVSSVYISKTMIEMNPNLYTKDVFIGKVAGQLDAVYIISTMDNGTKKDLRKDIDEFIQKGKYELLMKQKGVVSRSAFYVKRKGTDQVRELIMITDGAATLKFVSLIGDLTLKDIQKITSYQSTSDNILIFPTDAFKDIFTGKEFKLDPETLKKLEKLKDFKLSIIG
ncbi:MULTISPECIES: DUF4252 domain-containing protein [Bacteroides]|uniref:DUF4252 domain-containing protein n=1 Tax=Bacteroides TaxID=816 RepID=UPI0004B4007B|nr:DUF4252 domain-containing protein [Bacteroides neonati]MCP3895073.1 DUF4252 domain-containing protein [Bacteroides sp.]